MILAGPQGQLIGAYDPTTGDGSYFHTDALRLRGGHRRMAPAPSPTPTTATTGGDTIHLRLTDPTELPFVYTGQPGTPADS